MVIRVGASEVGQSVSSLVRDTRQMMEPYTASRLRERKSNKLKDFTAMAGPLGITQLLLFSRNDSTGSNTLRIATVPRGPTIHFRIREYSLCKDVRKRLTNPTIPSKAFSSPPLLVMNNFKTVQGTSPLGSPENMPMQDLLLIETFRNMFPAINPQQTPISNIRRVVCLVRTPSSSNYAIEVRHYAIVTKPVDVSRPIRRINAAEKRPKPPSDDKHLLKGAMPNLGNLNDIADYMLHQSTVTEGYISESEAEEDANVEVFPPVSRQPRGGRITRGAEKRAVKLLELGPRMTLEMVKIEEGLAEGTTMWHA